jgi:hypothetical protein
LDRRLFLRTVAGGSAAVGFAAGVGLNAAELRKQGMACILLFMSGAPSQFETFDPKPGTEAGGPTKAIPTNVPGVQIAEHWPQTAKVMNHVALIRSMTNKEGAHPRAVYQAHTGYAPTAAIKYPTFGSVVGQELGAPDSDLPSVVTVGGRTAQAAGVSAGFLGSKYAPFYVANPAQLPSNTALPSGVDAGRLKKRLGLMKDLEEDFAAHGGLSLVKDHQALYANAAQLVTSPKLKAFDIALETEAVRSRYGKDPFGQGCLLARRLVEAGVPFVEVESNGWDTHVDNFAKTKELAGPTDQGLAALIGDLHERGMLQKTLVIWMGEFGRTPRINPLNGRDHYPRAFTVALAGGGVRGAQVIGSTSADGAMIKERPVEVPDLLCSFCHALKLNPRKENMGPLERPIKIVEGGTVVKELFA